MNVFVYFLSLALVLQTAVTSPIRSQTFHIDLTAVHQISSGVFTCDSSSSEIRTLCKFALIEINRTLKDAGIAIASNGALFTYDDRTNSKIRTESSCTKTAQLNHKHISATFSRGASLNVALTAITEPVLVRVKLPARVRARVDVKQRAGVRTPFGCTKLFSDSFSFKADAKTNANIVVGFNLDPKIGTSADGNYIVIIKPKFSSVFALDDFKLKFRVSGKNPFASVFDIVTGLGSSVLKTATALIEGDSVSDVVSNSLVFDVGVPITLGLGSLPGPLERLIWNKLIGKFVEKEALNEAVEYSNKLEEKMNSKLKAEFGLNSQGERKFVVKKNVMSSLGEGKVPSEVFESVPENPFRKCTNDYISDFRDPSCIEWFCDYEKYLESETYCGPIQDKWKKSYQALKLAKANPKIAK